MEYRPMKKSFFSSLFLSLSPIITAGVATYFFPRLFSKPIPGLLWVLNAIMVLLSLKLLLNTLFVHKMRLYLDDHCVRSTGLFGTTQINWSEITEALLRERQNSVSRTDHLLILTSSNHLLSFNTSILAPEDEGEVLNKVREKTNLVIHQDRPTI